MTHTKAQGDTFPFGQAICWNPNEKWIADSNLRQFMDRHGIDTYDELQSRACADIEWFWNAAIEDLDIHFYRPYKQVIDQSQGVEFPRWCVDGSLNIVHNCLDKWQSTPTRDRIALRWEGEEGSIVTLTYAELYHAVNRCANGLLALGIGKGDAVALYMPMIPELAIAFLAIVKIGAVLLPLFSGYGPSAVTTRLADANARAVVTADGLWRRGRAVPMKPILDAAIEEAPTVEHVVVVDRLGLSDVPWHSGRDHWWHDLMAANSDEAPTERTDAEDVVMIIYTSGTTGRPKGAVHTHCGFPIKAAQDMRHSMDLKSEDTMYWMSDMGWMMGPWEVFGTLLNGATMLFYDGAPDYPAVDRLWDLVENHRVTHLGISPTLMRSLHAHGAGPIEAHDLSTLRIIGSTGSPWDPETWLWVFQTVLDGRKPIINY